MELVAIVTLRFEEIWTYFTTIYYTTLFTLYNKVAPSTGHVSKFHHKIFLINNLNLHLNEFVAHECVSDLKNACSYLG